MNPETWKNLPPENKPYPGRLNVIIGEATELAAAGLYSIGLDNTGLNTAGQNAEELDDNANIRIYPTLQEALDDLENSNDLDEIFLIGGEALFAEAILHPDLEEIHVTRVEEDYECNSFFPKDIPEEFEVASTSEIMESDGLEYSFLILTRNEKSEE